MAGRPDASTSEVPDAAAMSMDEPAGAGCVDASARSTAEVSRETEPVERWHDAAVAAFGDRLPLAMRYSAWLAGAAVERGLVGPREVTRLWTRHVLNCAGLDPLIPANRSVVDVGSGAGLPGLVIAIQRPDVHVTLLEPLLRRSEFLREVVVDLDLRNAEVERHRAEEWPGGRRFDVATARAVAPLARLAQWCLPLLRPGGQLLALKGRNAETEIEDATSVLQRLGAGSAEILTLDGEGDHSTRVVRITAGVTSARRPATGRQQGRGSTRRR